MSQYTRWPVQGGGGGGGGVTSFNGLTGSVDLLAGTGITLSTIGNNITVTDNFASTPEAANTVLAGPTSGAAAPPTFRLLTSSDIPTLAYVSTVGLIDSQTPSSNGLVISANSLYAQSASATNPGLVNNTTQTFSGVKTFNNNVSIISSSTGAFQVGSSSQFIFDSVNDALGMGVQPSTLVAIDIVNTSGTSKPIQITGYGTGSTAVFRGRTARGTSGSPTATQTGDLLGVFSARGYGATQFSVSSTAVMNQVAGENFTDTSNLTYFQFETTPTGSVTASESMRIASAGVTLGPQSGSTAIHKFNGGQDQTTNTITAATYTIDSVTTDYTIFTNSTSNAITITLPSASNGRTLIIQDKTGQASVNHITITPPGSVTINGINSSILIGINYSGWILMSDGTNWTASAMEPFVVPTQSISASSIDWSTGNLFIKTLSANTTFTFANNTSGQTIVVRLTNTASNFTVTWPTVKWTNQTTPTMTVGAFSDVYTFIYDGTNIFGSYVQNF